MLKSLREIFETGSIEINTQGERRPIHSHTPLEQGLFLQRMFDVVRPERSVEIGLALGISTLFILEKHRDKNSADGAHIVVEPDLWGDAAQHNIEKEGLLRYVSIRNDVSDRILPALYLEKHSIQFAYVDTTKLFDVVFQDFYFIDKILDVGGVIILDDCDQGGINKVARFIMSLPHYRVLDKIGRTSGSFRRKAAERLFSLLMPAVPYRRRLVENFSFKTNAKLALDYRCIAFQKIAADTRRWDWDAPL